MSNIESEIASEWYFRGSDAKPDDFQPPVPDGHVLERVVICVIVMANGCVYSGSSIEASESEQDKESARFLARSQAVSHILKREVDDFA